MDQSEKPDRSRPEEVVGSVGSVAIVGLGLLGASLGLSLRRHCPSVRILACARREESLRDAKGFNMIDEGSTNPADILPRADVTVLCIPIEPTIAFACEHAALWRPGCVVTDVGSVKCRIVDGIRGPLRERGVHFVGSHPMAGTENSGLGNAKRDLYDGAVVFITERDGDSRGAVQLVCRFWESIGMLPHRISPEPHDMLVARTSHVLHLLSYAAAKAYLVEEKAALATGGGFRDFTRIAASSPDMWVEIFQSNRDNVLAALDEFSKEMDDLRAMLTGAKWQELWDYLDDARHSRREWYAEWLQRREGLT